MDNNLTKNRFFSRSSQLDLTLDQISIKQIILKQLQDRITPRLTPLSDKIILLDKSNLPSLVYSCAIVFPLANLWGLPSLQVAQELVSWLAINNQESVGDVRLTFTVEVRKNGLIEFSLSDRSIGSWLEFVIRRFGEIGEIGEIEERGDYNLFPVQYVYNRCSSLLLLGAKEGLINLKNSVYANDTWQITNPNPFKYYCDQNIGYCYEPTELNLLRQLLLVIDYFWEFNCQKPQTLVPLTLNLSNSCLKFLAACRIFGSISQNKRDLAIARLGLIAIVQFYLQKIILKLN